MKTGTADPISSPRAIRLGNAWNDMMAAWAKLDHAVKAMRLRCSDPKPPNPPHELHKDRIDRENPTCSLVYATRLESLRNHSYGFSGR